MTLLGPSLAQSFQLAAGDLGMCSASWLFLRDVAALGGDAAVEELRDLLGRGYPVLDAVAAAWLGGARAPRIDTRGVVAVCRGATELLIVGLETDFLDALLPNLGGIHIDLLTFGPFATDWSRVLANYGDRVRGVDLASFQAAAGPRSVLLTFVYGSRGPSAHVLPSWSRVMGNDVRTQFRSIVGWDVLGAEMFVYPRWLVAAPIADFTEVV